MKGRRSSPATPPFNWKGGFWVFVFTSALLTILLGFYPRMVPTSLFTSLVTGVALIAGVRALVSTAIPPEEHGTAFPSYFFFSLMVSVLVMWLYIMLSQLPDLLV